MDFNCLGITNAIQVLMRLNYEGLKTFFRKRIQTENFTFQLIRTWKYFIAAYQ